MRFKLVVLSIVRTVALALLITLLFLEAASAAASCQKLLNRNVHTNPWLDDAELKQALFATKDPALKGPMDYPQPAAISDEALERRLKGMAQALIMANLENGDWPFNEGRARRRAIRASQIKITKVELDQNHRDYPYISAFYDYTAANGKVYRWSMSFRSNGSAAFLNSYAAAQKTAKAEFTMVYYVGDKLRSVDQTQAILATFPDSVVLSRGMTEGEAQQWQNKALGEINTSYSFQNQPRSYFALNYYRFEPNHEPYFFRVPTSVLLDLYAKGKLLINPYDGIEHWPTKGMPPEAQTAFGLEIELVVISREGQMLIHPFAAQLQQYSKPAGDYYENTRVIHLGTGYRLLREFKQ